jgi:cell shape-determining protein MreD
MTFFHSLFFSLVLVLLQTAVMPFLQILHNFYDLLITLVVYLSIFRTVREGLPVVVLLGVIMDGLSGGAMGLYTTVYIWLFACLRWVIGFLRVGNTFLLLFVVAAGVFVENLMFLGTDAFLRQGDMAIPGFAFKIVVVQLVWALFTGPLFLLLFSHTQKLFDGWVGERFGAKDSDE